MSDGAVAGSCHCGAVSFTLTTAPQQVTDCNCSICRRYGTLWAYYPLAQVQFGSLPATDTYIWGDRGLTFHRCRTCGCVTHWQALDPTHDRMAINARLLAPEVLAGASVKFFDGANGDG